MRRPPGSARWLTGALLAIVPACDKPQPAPGKDTVAPTTALPDSSPVPAAASSAWDSSAGPALLVAAQLPEDAVLILPSYSDTSAMDTARVDLTSLRSAQVELYSAGQRVGIARIEAVTPPTRSDSCRSWAHARLSMPAAAAESMPAWSVAFIGHRADPVVIDSIEGMAPPDSAKLAADVARLASALPGDTAVAFRGLPFVVKRAWRFRLPGLDGLASVVVRNVNQEANPLHEQLLIIAERDSVPASAQYRPVFSERRSGLEETLEVTDLLTLVLLGTERRPTLVLARDSGSGSSYVMMERAAGKWRRRWASAYAGC